MKQLPLFLFVLFYGLRALTQGTTDLTVKVVDNQGKPLTGAAIRLFEPSLRKSLSFTSDAGGSVKTILAEGEEWQLFINGSATNRFVSVPESGQTRKSMTETYDPARAARLGRQTSSRAGLKAEPAEVAATLSPGRSAVELTIKNGEGKLLPGLNVYLLDINTRKYWRAVTSAQGLAKFIVPSGSQFDIDIENYLNASTADLPKSDGMILSKALVYNAPDFTEKTQGDTIIQFLDGSSNKASGRSFVKLKVHRDGAAAAHEHVYLQEINGQSVFRLKTSEDGEASVFLPFGKKYMVHFDFQRDVDAIDLTHAFGNARHSLELTYHPDPRLEHPELFIPEPGKLFLVDFEHFLTKQYPKPVSPKQVNLFTRFTGEVNASSKEAVLEIGYTAQGKAAAVPLNICFVLDISGSMAGYYRIERLKESMISLLQKLDDQAMISLVTFESKMSVVQAPIRLGNCRLALVQLIDVLQVGGGTNMLAALKQGYSFVQQHNIPKGNNRIVILTDGYDENEVQVLIDAQKAFPASIECTTIGVGEDYNYALLKQLATNGRGMLHFVGKSEDFPKVLGEQFLELVKPLATEVTLEVEYNDRIVFKQLYGPREMRLEKGKPVYYLPNLYNGANCVALAKFDLVRPDETIQRQPVIIRMKYRDPDSGQPIVLENKEYLVWRNYTGIPELVAEHETKKLFCIAILNQAIKVMAEFHAAGKSSEAQKTLERTRVQVKELYPKAGDKDVEALLVSLDGYLAAFKNLARKKSLVGP